jgi:hypothetical protein
MCTDIKSQNENEFNHQGLKLARWLMICDFIPLEDYLQNPSDFEFLIHYLEGICNPKLPTQDVEGVILCQETLP